MGQERIGMRFALCRLCKAGCKLHHWSAPVLSRSKGHGLLRTKESKLVAVHDRCKNEGAAIARQQGYLWEAPPPPEWHSH